MKLNSVFSKFDLCFYFILICLTELLNCDIPACSSPIYCSGPLLDLVQRSKVLKSSIDFVGRPTKRPIQLVLESFNALPQNASKNTIKEFVDLNFLETSDEVKQYKLDELKSDPKFLNNIRDSNLKQFASNINLLWQNLSRVQDFSKLCDGCVTSLLPAKYPFIVPGGRFEESYYWDSYFTMKGLLISELYKFSKGIILNLLQFVEKYGLVPNGQRVYYLNRSQPPFLIPMVMDYYLATSDIEFVKESLPILEKEYNYWIREHSVNVPCELNTSGVSNTCVLTRYIVKNTEPRPESYNEDIETVENSNLTDKQKLDLYADLATGAETGWDYSTRWTKIKVDETINIRNKNNYEEILRTLHTREIVPIDLNSFMYNNEMIMAQFYNLTNTNNNQTITTKSNLYLSKAAKRAEVMHNIMLSDGLFYDFDISTMKPTKQYSQASYSPFFVDCLSPKFKKDPNNYLTAYKKLLTDDYGLPVTLFDSGLQWDYPNIWAPMEYIVIEGAVKSAEKLKQVGTEDSLKVSQNLNSLALNLTSTYVNNVYCAYMKNSNLLFEKYHSHKSGTPGGGGEYEVQSGFGWTNGVIQYLINKFGDSLSFIDESKCRK